VAAAGTPIRPAPGFEESAAKAKDFFRRVVVPNEKTFIADKRGSTLSYGRGQGEGKRMCLLKMEDSLG